MQKTLIIADNAGGADILAHFVLKNKNKYLFFICLRGPAKKIFKERCPGIKNIALNDFIRKYKRENSLILTGTSYHSNFESKAIKQAKQRGMFCVSFLDHWVGYKERFLPGFLPNEIWVGDKFAFELALREGFAKNKLRLVPNPLFKKIKSLGL